jgi:hypothetical protein
VNIDVSLVDLSGSTLEPCVDWSVMITVALPNSGPIVHLCNHDWDVENLQQRVLVLTTAIKPWLAGQHLVKLQLCRSMCAPDVIAMYELARSACSHAKQ